ncbi:hypothetical protein C6T53_23290 [Burkholderia multivorans]|nr:hypothetical protein C6T53_23290 [Burkholderia multivorans]
MRAIVSRSASHLCATRVNRAHIARTSSDELHDIRVRPARMRFGANVGERRIPLPTMRIAIVPL